MTAPLRVGFLLDGLVVQAWQQAVIASISREPGLAVGSFAITGKAAQGASQQAGRLRLLTFHKQLDLRLHQRWVARAFAPTNLAPTQGNVPILHPESGEEQSVNEAFDVLIRLGSSLPDGRMLRWARYGVWAIRYGNGHPKVPDCFDEHFRGRPVVECVLEMHKEDGAARVLDRASLSLDAVSPARTRALAYEKSSSIFLRRLRRLRDGGEKALLEVSTDSGDAPPPAAAPEDGPMLRFLGRYAFSAARKAIHWSMFDIYHWRVAVGARPARIALVDCASRTPFRIVDCDRDRFHADPFLFEHGGTTYLFLEEFLYEKNRGRLAAAPLGADGSPGSFVTVMEDTIHLSYPFIFSWNGRIYMTPETGDRNRVELYRCEHFPDKWVFERVLVEGACADPTLVEHAGRLWLFGSRSASSELHVFFADDLYGTFQPHSLNPVVSDVRRSRPGGRIFREGDTWVRPAQDCGQRYGCGLTFNRIVTMTPTDYAEEVMRRVGSSDVSWLPRAGGIHSFDATSRFCVTDASSIRFRGSRWVRQLSRRAAS